MDYRYYVDPVPHILISDPFGFQDQTKYNKDLQINLDVSIAIPCMFLRVDVLDLTNTRLSVSDKIKKESVIFKSLEGTKKLTDSWDGYEGDVSDIVDGANRQSWSEWWNDGTTKENVKFDFNKAREKGEPLPGPEGCRIHGSIYVQRITGMLHITSSGHGYGGIHTPHEAINFTHRMDHFSFGKRYPGLKNPLDKTYEIDNSRSTMFQYFLAIIPTVYRDFSHALFSKTIETNQYSVTDYSKELEHDSGIPGIFFKYDIEPLCVDITQTRMSFLHLITRICGIVGGVFATAGMILEIINATKRFIHHIIYGFPTSEQSHNGSSPSDTDALLSKGIFDEEDGEIFLTVKEANSEGTRPNIVSTGTVTEEIFNYNRDSTTTVMSSNNYESHSYQSSYATAAANPNLPSSAPTSEPSYPPYRHSVSLPLVNPNQPTINTRHQTSYSEIQHSANPNMYSSHTSPINQYVSYNIIPEDSEPNLTTRIVEKKD